MSFRAPFRHPGFLFVIPDLFGDLIHGNGVFGGQVAVFPGLSTEMAFLVDKLPFFRVCPRKRGVLVDKLPFSRVCPRKWRFWWTSCRFPGFVHGNGVFGGQVAVFTGLSTEMQGFGGWRD
jgi:hypothetical protein